MGIRDMEIMPCGVLEMSAQHGVQLCEGCQEAPAEKRYCPECTALNAEIEARYERTRPQQPDRIQCDVVQHTEGPSLGLMVWVGVLLFCGAVWYAVYVGIHGILK